MAQGSFRGIGNRELPRATPSGAFRFLSALRDRFRCRERKSVPFYASLPWGGKSQINAGEGGGNKITIVFLDSVTFLSYILLTLMMEGLLGWGEETLTSFELLCI